MKYSVLVVEDEWLIAREYGATLTKAGYQVVGPASSAATALALLETNQVHLAILDFQLRGETSVAVAEHLKAAGIPTMLVTGHAPTDLPVEYSDALILAKPLEGSSLIQKAGRLLHSQKTGAGGASLT